MDKSVVIFDGVCNLCNQSVDFIIRRDRHDRFQFTANQHESGRGILEKMGRDPDDVHTIYLYEDGKLFERSTAALRIARKMDFPYSLLYGFIVVPPFIRDAVYRFIAANRYVWFGKKETCRIPTPEERAKFI